jgi:hypothetical protein
MSPPARVLVVANRTADSAEIQAALLERAQQGAIEADSGDLGGGRPTTAAYSQPVVA